ncbi:ABC transporter permease [Pseudomonas sp. MOB-449]|nr:ABC transporter permease [Pseudomonas sp. MOB-449]
MRVIYLFLYLAFLFAPILVITIFSFNSSPALVFPLEGFSLQWYENLFSNPEMMKALWNSVLVGTATAVITTLLGTMSALALARLKGRAKEAFSFLSFIPIALPGLFLGIALLVIFALAGIGRSLITVTIAHVLFTLPFFIEAVRSRVEYFDLSLEEAARDLGASPATAFRKVTIPIIAPTIVGAAILSFALSFDEFLITIFVVGNESTLPMFIWSMLRRTVNPTVNAASVIALVLSIGALLAVALLYHWQRKKAISSRQEFGA